MYAYNTANELTKQTLSGTDTNFAYDAWGRMTGKTQGGYSAAYGYRYGGKLYSVASNFPGEGTVTYDYDGEGKRRSAAVSGGLTTTYRYDAGWNVLKESVAGGTKTYVHGPGGILADVSGSYLASGTYRYYAQDHLGSTRGLYDSNIDGLASYEYSPYGEEYAHTGQAANFQFTGQIWDPTANLYYFAFRYYSPGIARWLTRDPIGELGGLDRYGYVGGSPISSNDPLGLAAETGCEGQCLKIKPVRIDSRNVSGLETKGKCPPKLKEKLEGFIDAAVNDPEPLDLSTCKAKEGSGCSCSCQDWETNEITEKEVNLRGYKFCWTLKGKKVECNNFWAIGPCEIKSGLAKVTGKGTEWVGTCKRD